MKTTKLLATLLLFIAAAFNASAKVKIGSLYYNLDSSTKTAEVTYLYYASTDNQNYVSGDLVIPSTVEYDGTTYSVTSIGDFAFYYCSGLTAVSIPNSVTYIGYRAFRECSGLTSVTIPNSVTYIGDDAFRGCSGLTSVTIPNSVTEIKDYAFEGCSGLKSVTIGNSVTSIDYRAFRYCSGLKSVTIGNSVTSIGYEAFSNTDITKAIWLTNTPPEGASNVGATINYVSNNQYSLSNQTVYPSLSSKFEVDNVVYVPVSPSDRTCDVIDCNYIPTSKTVTIDSVVNNRSLRLKVLNVNPYAFYGNDSIAALTIKHNGDIGSYAFSGCTALASAVVDNHGYIDSYAFSGCNMGNSLTIGDNVTAIYGYAFYNNKGLRKVVIPDSVTSVGASAFEGCSSLNNVTIGKGVNELSASLFKGCSSLASLTIPSSVNAIGDYVFSGCSKLADVTFEDSKSETQTFSDWTSTNHSNSSKSSTQYNISAKSGDVLSFEIWSDSETGCDILTVYLDGNTLATISGTGQQKMVTHTFTDSGTINLKVEYVKDSSQSSGTDQAGIRNIGVNFNDITLGSNGSSPLFVDCPLDDVYIGRKLSYKTTSSYGYSPFYRNTSLKTVKITDKETEIYDNEFYGCSNLQSFECGDVVTKIGKWAFSGCSALQSYASGTSVESIGEEAFSDCTGLTSFATLAAMPPVCGKQALDDINKWECTLYVLPESIDYYKAADQWKEFFFIDYPSGIDEIEAEGTGGDTECGETVIEGYYNLQGVRSDKPWDGMNIVVYGDGSRRKLVK